MMPQINGAMVAVSSSPILSIVVKATLITALGLIGARLARRRRAAVRHALVAVTFGVLLVLPVASIVVPPVRIAVPIEARAWTVSPSLPEDIDAISPIAQVGTTAGATPAMPQS